MKAVNIETCNSCIKKMTGKNVELENPAKTEFFLSALRTIQY